MTFADRPHMDINSLHKTKRNAVELPVRSRPPKCQDLVDAKRNGGQCPDTMGLAE